MELDVCIKGRRSVRSYTDEPVLKEQVEAVLEAGVWAPTGMWREPWRFIVIENKELDTAFLQTSGDAAKIILTPDRKKISANGQDLSFVTIEVTDKDGTLQPNAQNQLKFNVTGPGLIAGLANADMKDVGPYVGTTRKAWHGRALVVIRSTKNAGDINLIVSSPGLTDAVVTIRSELK